MNVSRITHSVLAAFDLGLVLFIFVIATAPPAEAISPFPVGHKDPPSDVHADYSKCPDPTLPGASCQTPVSYGPCLVLLFDNGIREFNCDANERHSFPSGLDTYLSVNGSQAVSELLRIDGDRRDCPYARCDTYVVITEFVK